MSERGYLRIALNGSIIAAGLMAGCASACVESPPRDGHEGVEASREEPAPEPQAGLTVFADKDFYLDRPEPVETLVGVLRRVEVRVGPDTREMPLRLVVDDAEISVYTSGFDITALRPFIGRRVEIVGKRVDLGSEGHGVEVWPATVGFAPR